MVLDIVGLEISVPELIWTIINFFLLMFLLKIVLYKPILRILDERKANIKQGLAEGKAAQETLNRTNEEVARALADENGKARELVGQAKAKAEKVKSEVLSDAHSQAEQLRKDVRARIDGEEASARGEIDDSMPELVMLLTNKLLGGEDAECSEELVKSCLSEQREN